MTICYRQGSFDDFCGTYAIINGLRSLVGSRLTENICTDVYRELTKALMKLDRDRSVDPDLTCLIEGTDIPELTHLLHVASEFLRGKGLISRALNGRELRIGNRARQSFLRKLRDVLKEGERSFAILCVRSHDFEDDDSHWVVSHLDAVGDLEVLDSLTGVRELTSESISLREPAPLGRWYVKPTVFHVCLKAK